MQIFHALQDLLRQRRSYLPAAAVAALCVAYIFWFAHLTSLPLQDFPNHLARAQIIDDLLFNAGARFGGQFTWHFIPMPYALHDLVLASLVHVFGAALAASIFMTIVLLSLPAALWFYMRVSGVSPRIQPAVIALALFLSTDWFFLMGFLAFRLAVAFIVLSLAMAELLRVRWSLARYASYVAVLVAGYLTHLTAPVFFLVVIGLSAANRVLWKRSPPAREALLVLPVIVLLALHFAFPHETAGPDQHGQYLYEWGTLFSKLHSWSYEFARFGGRVAMSLIGLLALCLLLGASRALKLASLKSPLVVENLVITLAFVGLYILMPRDYADAAYVDVRALAMFTLFLLISTAWLSNTVDGRGYGSVAVAVLAFLVVAANLGWIAVRQRPLDLWMSHYRAVVATVPEKARVLPVSTHSKVGSFYPFLHAGSFLILDRGALMPYLFSGNGGDPMKSFTYVRRPYMPHESWYLAQVKWRQATPASYSVLGEVYTWRFQYSIRDGVWEPATMVPVDWTRVACDYDWLLVAKPYDATLIGVGTRLKAENDAAALLAVDTRECRPSPPPGPVRLRSEH